MAKYNLNYLVKDELAYELLTRGEEVIHDNVESLRKQLRKCQDNPPDVRNLNGKITLKNEVGSIQTKLDSLELLLDQCSQNISNLQVAKINAKICHLKLRIGNLSKCKLDETYDKTVEGYSNKLSEFESIFSNLKDQVDTEEFSLFEENLNKSLVDEEEGSDKINLLSKTPTDKETYNTAISPQNPVTVPIGLMTLDVAPVVNICENIARPKPEQSISMHETNVFNKLSNPAEMYLQKFTLCNGLDISELLRFLRNFTELRTLSSLNPNQIYEILPGYTSSPLLNKVLECKTQHLSLDSLHTEIINTFIPITLKEKLKQDLIYRPQQPSEPLSLYINEIKTNHQILQCNLTESELVSFIKNGINPETRNKLVFQNNPLSFKDLDELCVNLNNVQYNDHIRNQVYQNSTHHYAENRPTQNSSYNNYGTQNNSHNFRYGGKSHPTNSRNYGPPKQCFNCNRKGHTAKECYRPRNPKNL